MKTHPHILLSRLHHTIKSAEECGLCEKTMNADHRDHLARIREAFNKLNERLKASDAVNRELARREA